jgi:hypothetical protein
MLSKIFLTGKMFPETCRYVCEDLERAEVLDVEGVRAHDYELMAFDFASQHQTRPEREKPVFHAALTFPHGEDPGDEKLVSIARNYLREIGMVETQHAIVKHTDKEHLHLHIIANRVNNDGETIGKGMIVDRGIDAARKLTKFYQLKEEKGKNLERTNRDALHEPDAERYRLYEVIRKHLPLVGQMEDLEKRLQEEGVTVRYRHNPVDGVREGISFKIGRYAFAGNKVDPAFTLKKLEATMLRQRLEWERDERERLERERLERERLVTERLEVERLQRERLAKEQLEMERLERERQLKEQKMSRAKDREEEQAHVYRRRLSR